MWKPGRASGVYPRQHGAALHFCPQLSSGVTGTLSSVFYPHTGSLPHEAEREHDPHFHDSHSRRDPSTAVPATLLGSGEAGPCAGLGAGQLPSLALLSVSFSEPLPFRIPSGNLTFSAFPIILPVDHPVLFATD